MIFETLQVGLFQCNCSILGCPETREAVCIDPGDEVDRIVEILDKHNLKLKYIIHTHAHIDHIGGVKGLKDATGAAVLLHPDDLFLYNDVAMQAEMIGLAAPPVAETDGLLKDGDRLRCGNTISIDVLHTPGHTPGSLSFHLPDNTDKLFTGDTLFMNSIGRTDLWGGSFREIMRSIHQKLMAFKDETIVYPGHGPATTIGRERKLNPFLQSGGRFRFSF